MMLIGLMPDKAELRRRLLAQRDSEPEREVRSRRIAEHLRALPAFADAATICWYVGVRSEVPTLALIEESLAAGRRAVVPACRGDDLQLAEIRATDELAPAQFGLLEPTEDVCMQPDRICPPGEIDLFIVPGVGFDPAGHRLGYGRGYYDRLFAVARPEAWRIALAYRSQVVPELPSDPHDVPMHLIVTEAGVIGPGHP
ncbi:MAG TPA: 5-formyltetrahydrofolate cyclo-ligase [Gemmatimonadales bacterium]|nr:5-formyltetrahydrofolate cyclo-ligase [Gemmatimonadales bacterium]